MKNLVSFSFVLLLFAAFAFVGCQKESLTTNQICVECQELPKNLDQSKVQSYLNLIVEQINSSKSVVINFSSFNNQSSDEFQFVKSVYTQLSEEQKLSLLNPTTTPNGQNVEYLKYKRNWCVAGVASWTVCDTQCRPLGGSILALCNSYVRQCF